MTNIHDFNYSPIDVGYTPDDTGVPSVIGTDVIGTNVIDTGNPVINTLKLRPGDINQPELPPIFNKLTSDEAKKEFKAFWNLVQSIESNPNAHHVMNGPKLLITNGPLKLSNFFQDLMSFNNDFNIEDFLEEHGITLNDGAFLINAELNDAQLNDAQLNSAKLDGAELNRAQLNRAQLNDAELYGAELNDAQLNGAILNGAFLNGAFLNGAKLDGAQLVGAELYGAELNRAELNGANLLYAKLHGAELKGIVIDKNTDFKGAILTNIICDSIKFENENGKIEEITGHENIRAKLIELGAEDKNISFLNSKLNF
jgi:uncharacterized protein YjbI with pentapeptide repeats